MTTFIYEIQVTTQNSTTNIGETKSLETAHHLVAKSVKQKGSLITIEKLKIQIGKSGVPSFEHIETFEFETV